MNLDAADTSVRATWALLCGARFSVLRPHSCGRLSRPSYNTGFSMGFLDNLESDLKNLEGNNERESSADEHFRRERERAQALAAAPYADELKKGAFTMGLLDHATRIGFAQRVKVNITWLGPTLRLEARERWLELKPEAKGVIAVFSESGQELSKTPVDLKSDPEKLARQWLEFNSDA